MISIDNSERTNIALKISSGDLFSLVILEIDKTSSIINCKIIQKKKTSILAERNSPDVQPLAEKENLKTKIRELENQLLIKSRLIQDQTLELERLREYPAMNLTLNKTIKKKFNVILLGSFLTQFWTDKNIFLDFVKNYRQEINKSMIKSTLRQMCAEARREIKKSSNRSHFIIYEYLYFKKCSIVSNKHYFFISSDNILAFIKRLIKF
ncbi:hypothetical protein BpHYR1_042563 [Brachionus plicatilis]|uniref:Uncharacterized protein n=1 Tax=Brachionus plicatilis TaxID=10195 RepID=A0A3M7SAU1_BRAPC|nr:hypothetical protein BpHYR1_042563 [Brachionus plicatilis]